MIPYTCLNGLVVSSKGRPVSIRFLFLLPAAVEDDVEAKVDGSTEHSPLPGGRIAVLSARFLNQLVPVK